MSTLDQELMRYDEEFKVTYDESTGGRRPLLQPGEYQARIDVCRVEPSQFGDLQWTITWESDGAVRTQWIRLTGDNSDIGRRIAADVLKVLGIYDASVNGLSGLPAACEAGMFNDLLCDIKIVEGKVKDQQSGERYPPNIYVNKCHGVYATTGEVTAPAEDDDIPF